MTDCKRAPKNRMDFSKVCTSLVFQGVCRYGKRCRYSHEQTSVNAMRNHLHDAMQKPCPGLVRGEECRFGAQCWYNHDPHFIAACEAAKTARHRFATKTRAAPTRQCGTCRALVVAGARDDERVHRYDLTCICAHCGVECCLECSSLERAPFNTRAVVHNACRMSWHDAVFPRLWDDGYIAEFPKLRC